MTNMTLAIPEELFRKMREFREIRWSEIARQAIENMNRIASKSKLREKDVLEIGKRIKSSAAKKFNESG